MVADFHTAYVHLWGMLMGAVAWDPDRGLATFEFDAQFLEKGLDPAPIKMPMRQARRGAARFTFSDLPRRTFKGLPGMLADALPDRYGNALIDAWLARQGRPPESFSPVERLCYTGRRAMGALEFSPTLGSALEQSVPVEIGRLVELAQTVVDERSRLDANLDTNATGALLDIIRVGTSAGGARPKAVIAVNDRTGAVRSGQVDAPEGFDYWILKFDGVQDRSLGDPAGYGRIEYAYHHMALKAGIRMTECRLLEENGRAHFMTRRFDRTSTMGKRHLQSLCAVAHLDYNNPGAYAYEQAFQTMREMRLPYEDAEQLFRRMIFNVAARNQDDHTKNIAFLMDQQGRWRLAPAFDLIYAYNPQGLWTSRHQMSINGKRDDLTRGDLLQVAGEMNIKSADAIIEQVLEAVSNWPQLAAAAGVQDRQIRSIAAVHRLLRRRERN